MYSTTQSSQSVRSPREEIHAADAGHSNNLDLSLGMSVHGLEDKSGGANLKTRVPAEKSVLCAGGSSGDTAGAGGAVLHRHHVVSSCFGSERSWFVHPCFEERQLKTASGAPPPPPQSEIMREAQPTAPVVGWPPVRASRKNLSGPRLSTKPSMEADEKEAKKSKTSEDRVEACNNRLEESKVIMAADAAASTMTMFVKVNMEGLAVGRKIDLMAHDGYGSLSTTLRKLFDSFLSGKKKSIVDGECGDENGDAKISGSLELLYEDNEGDKLLVGDVPWEMFVGSVKRLYITYRRKTHHHCELKTSFLARGGRAGDINVK